MIVRTITRAENSEKAARKLENKLGFSLRRFEHNIDFVEVILEDENGPKGGRDKKVSVSVHQTDGGVRHYSFIGEKWSQAGKEVIRMAKYGMQNRANKVARMSKNRKTIREGWEVATA